MRFAIRTLIKNPGFTLPVILTLALGIGATTAIFSVVDAVLLRPLPYPDSNRLVMMRDELSKMKVHYNDVTYDTYEGYRRTIKCFEATAAFTQDQRNLIGSQDAERVSVISSTPELLKMLGARTSIGRSFAQTDWNAEHSDVAILSHSLFVDRFGSDPAALKRPIRLNGRLYTVIGVMAPRFTFGLDGKNADIWIPLATMKDPDVWQFRMLARLKPGISIETARASLKDAANYVEKTVRPYRGPNDEDGGYQATLMTLRNRLLGDFQTGALLLLGAVSLLLLIACVNVTNLLLARALSREKETALRLALGASGMRLFRQWMTEAAVLVSAGGALGLLLSHWCIQLLEILSRDELPDTTIGIDLRVLLFSFGVSAFVCVLLSIAPALTAFEGKTSLRGPLRKRNAANWLVASEVAIAIVLLAGGGLLTRSFVRLQQIDTGVRVQHILTMQVQLSGVRYQTAEQRIRYFTGLQEKLAKLPGTLSASVVSVLPVFKVGADVDAGNPFSLDDRPWNPNSPSKQMAHTLTAGIGYFKTMGIPVLKGRDFLRSDTIDSVPVAVINKTLENRFFPHGDAIGRRILLGAPAPGVRWLTIVGVISDIRTGSLNMPPAPQFYTSEMQDANDHMFAVVQTQADPAAMSRAARLVAHQLDSEQAVTQVMTMERHIEGTLGQPRFRAMLTASFAFAALLLAVVGIYGVVARGVVQRTKEIGIRSALGANPAKIVIAVMNDGLQPITVGVALGIVAAAVFTRYLSSVLYQVKPDDPATFLWSALIIFATGAAACLAPALRASRLDPLIALRNE